MSQMKTLLELMEEKANKLKPVVMSFGRMQPPTIGHEKLIQKVHELSNQHSAPHHVILSHSRDTKNNPLSPVEKMRHARHAFPGTNFEASSKEMPTFLHHAKRLNDAGHKHLIMVTGADRAQEFHNILNKYNGNNYKFNKIEVKIAGPRNPDSEGIEGVSASKLREYARNNDFNEFKKGVPSAMAHHHAKALFRDLRKGMGLHENVDRGLFKAIFITGGPGSGKDLIIREGIPEVRIVELDIIQAVNYLLDKRGLYEQSKDVHKEAIRNRFPLIINGSADNFAKILQIKEELEELGYSTMMVYVDTTNAVSKERNAGLRRMVEEHIREDKWKKAQVSKVEFYRAFDDFNLFQNNDEIEVVEENITDVYEHVNEFLDREINDDIACTWLVEHNKEDVIFPSDKKKPTTSGKKILLEPKKKYLNDDNSPVQQMVHKSGKKDDVKDGDVKMHSNYIFRTYSEKVGSQPKLIVNPPPKIPNFRKDKETGKKGHAINNPNKRIRTAGVGPEFDTRQQGTAYPGGMGNLTYSEEDKYQNGTAAGRPKSFRTFREAIDDPGANDMGVGGVLGGATHKEPMDVEKDKTGERDFPKKKLKKFNRSKK